MAAAAVLRYERSALNLHAREEVKLASLITGAELRKAVEDQSFIKGGEVRCAEGVKYDFRLSRRLLKAKWGQPVNMDEKSEEDLFIDGGEVVFVLTEERLELPSDIMAVLSPKRKLSHEGILSMGGLCIDPGYNGRLLIGLFNISSTRWPLRRGNKLIAATFHRLQGSEVDDFPPPPEPLDDFPDDLVRVIREYQPVAVQKLAAGLDGLETQVADLRREMRDREDWAKSFQRYLDAHNEQIGRLTADLQAEVEARKIGQDELTKALSWLKGAAWTLTGILGLALAVLVAWLTGLIPTP
jgi:dCTP deaminase